jgi:NTE family protein
VARGSFLTTFAKIAQTQTCPVGQEEMKEADVLIDPSVSVTDMKGVMKRDEAILAGYRTTKTALPKLLELMGSRCRVTLTVGQVKVATTA